MVATRGTRILFVSACLVVTVWGLKAGAPFLVPFTLALFLAVLSLPFMVWLQSKGLPRSLAIFLTVMVSVAVLVGFALVITQSFTEFRAALPRYLERAELMYESGMSWLEARRVPVRDWVAPNFFAIETIPDLISPESLVGVVGGTLRGIMWFIGNTFIVLLIMIFILAEATAFPAKVRLALGSAESDFSRWVRVTREVQVYLGIKTAISVLTGVLIGLWLWILGVDFALFWGVIAFLFNYIPNIGSILASIPAVLLALLQLGPGPALAAGAGYLVVNIVLGNLIEPGLQGRKFGLSTLVVVLSLIFWGWIWGPVGMILSLPLTMVLKIALENTEDFRWLAILLGSPPKPAAPPHQAGIDLPGQELSPQEGR